jgi:small subunit ribosomal protein S9
VSDAEHPEDEQRSEDQETAAPQEQPSDAETPEPVAEAPAEPEPVAEAPAEPEPVAEAPAEPMATPEAVPETPPAAEAPPAAPEAAPVSPQAAPTPAATTQDGEDVDETPRQRPEIPGADLIPDIVSESDEFMDAEARAAVEAEAEVAAARAGEENEDEARPIADAAIDLAAGARYTSTGKRKTAVARVILKPGSGTYSVNGKELDDFFPRDTLRRVIRQPLEAVGYESRMDVVAKMHGGGVAAQAGALRHGISRALIVADPNLRGELKRRGFLTRDPRVKERKKAGLKKARKRPQFSKR